MPFRLIEIVLPTESVAAVSSLENVVKVIERWDDQLNDHRSLVRMLVNSRDAEALLENEGCCCPKPHTMLVRTQASALVN